MFTQNRKNTYTILSLCISAVGVLFFSTALCAQEGQLFKKLLQEGKANNSENAVQKEEIQPYLNSIADLASNSYDPASLKVLQKLHELFPSEKLKGLLQKKNKEAQNAARLRNKSDNQIFRMIIDDPEKIGKGRRAIPHMLVYERAQNLAEIASKSRHKSALKLLSHLEDHYGAQLNEAIIDHLMAKNGAFNASKDDKVKKKYKTIEDNYIPKLFQRILALDTESDKIVPVSVISEHTQKLADYGLDSGQQGYDVVELMRYLLQGNYRGKLNNDTKDRIKELINKNEELISKNSEKNKEKKETKSQFPQDSSYGTEWGEFAIQLREDTVNALSKEEVKGIAAYALGEKNAFEREVGLQYLIENYTSSFSKEEASEIKNSITESLFQKLAQELSKKEENKEMPDHKLTRKKVKDLVKYGLEEKNLLEAEVVLEYLAERQKNLLDDKKLLEVKEKIIKILLEKLSVLISEDGEIMMIPPSFTTKMIENYARDLAKSAIEQDQKGILLYFAKYHSDRLDQSQRNEASKLRGKRKEELNEKALEKRDKEIVGQVNIELENLKTIRKEKPWTTYEKYHDKIKLKEIRLPFESAIEGIGTGFESAQKFTKRILMVQPDLRIAFITKCFERENQSEEETKKVWNLLDYLINKFERIKLSHDRDSETTTERIQLANTALTLQPDDVSEWLSLSKCIEGFKYSPDTVGSLLEIDPKLPEELVKEAYKSGKYMALHDLVLLKSKKTNKPLVRKDKIQLTNITVHLQTLLANNTPDDKGKKVMYLLLKLGQNKGKLKTIVRYFFDQKNFSALYWFLVETKEKEGNALIDPKLLDVRKLSVDDICQGLITNEKIGKKVLYELFNQQKDIGKKLVNNLFKKTTLSQKEQAVIQFLTSPLSDSKKALIDEKDINIPLANGIKILRDDLNQNIYGFIEDIIALKINKDDIRKSKQNLETHIRLFFPQVEVESISPLMINWERVDFNEASHSKLILKTINSKELIQTIVPGISSTTSKKYVFRKVQWDKVQWKALPFFTDSMDVFKFTKKDKTIIAKHATNTRDSDPKLDLWVKKIEQEKLPKKNSVPIWTYGSIIGLILLASIGGMLYFWKIKKQKTTSKKSRNPMKIQ